MLLIDTSTGTVLTAEYCRLLTDSALTNADWEALDGMSDSEASELARERGRPIVPDSQALEAIAELLSAADWTPEHLESVANIVRSTGRVITDL
jgi:hypothetical protein